MNSKRILLDDNLIKNGDFERSLEHWEGRNLEVGTVAGRRGLRGNPERVTAAWQSTGQQITAGKTYWLQFLTISENATPWESITIQLGFSVDGVGHPGLYTMRYDNQTWARFQGPVTPQVSGELEANIYLINQSLGIRVYITDVAIAERLTAPQGIARCVATRCRRMVGRQK